MQFDFFGDEPHTPQGNTFISLKILLRCQGKSEIEMSHEFQKYFDMCKIMDGDLFLAKVANSLRSAPKFPLCNILSFDVHSVNKKLISNKLPRTWTSGKPEQGFVFKLITFRPSHFLVKDVGILLKSDISLEECGPLLHGCRLVDYTGRDFLYLFYNEVTREFRVEAQPPALVKKMESLKTICLAATAASRRISLDYLILPLDLQCSMQHCLSPRQQMASKGCFKTVKVWHSNQKLWQEIDYDVETKKYHGRARMWDSSERLILDMHFQQGLAHGSCVTFDTRAGGFCTSLTVFEHNAPTGERIRFHLVEEYKQTTQYRPGSCDHRIRFHTMAISDDDDEGTNREEHGWGLLWCDPEDLKWKEAAYDNAKTRDSWDSNSLYYRVHPSSSLARSEGFVPPCLCVKRKVDADAAAAAAAVEEEKKCNLQKLQQWQKRKFVHKINSKQETFLKMKKIKLFNF